MEPHPSIPKVALMIETSREIGRELLRGILKYARLHGPWGVHVVPGDLMDQKLPDMRVWEGSGIIARISTKKMGDAILKSKLPVVAVDLEDEQLLPDHPLSKLPELRNDSYAIGVMAAEFFLDMKYRHFAYVGEIDDVTWSRRRQNGFVERLAKDGFECKLYCPSKRKHVPEVEQNELGDWLRTLSKPTALFAAMDLRGIQILTSCRLRGIRVPDEIAVLGVDNDELLCNIADPPLSSIRINAEQGGFNAAALLDRLMKGETGEPRRILFGPVRVVARRSTEYSGIDNPLVARAYEFIRNNAHRPINVVDVAKHLRSSRRAVEIRFKRAMGHTIHQEILKRRIGRIKELLLETDYSLAVIATMAGFDCEKYMSKVFLKKTGMTTSQFRKFFAQS